MQARLFSEILSAQKRLLVAGDVSTRHGRWRAAARVAETLAQQVDAEEWSAQITRALERALLDGDASGLITVLEALQARIPAVGHTLLQPETAPSGISSVNYTGPVTEPL